MENEIKNLPPKAQLLRRCVRTIFICAIILIFCHLVTPGANWGLWATAGIAIMLIFDIIDFLFVNNYKKEQQ